MKCILAKGKANGLIGLKYLCEHPVTQISKYRSSLFKDSRM